jgi:hypothetical protein
VFVVYLLLSAAGLIGTWYFNLTFDPAAGDGPYLAAWFANPASSSAAIDLLVVAVAAVVFMILEGRRLRLRITWVCVLLTVPVALAFTFPLFLAFRHRRLAGSGADAPVAGGSPARAKAHAS